MVVGAPATTEGYVEVPGGRVWYRIVGTDRPGTPVLCLHGGPGMPHDYLEPLEDLAASRPVVFYDQLGCGRSDRPADDSLWNTERFVEELAVVGAALGLERPHLFGNSWGGWLALQYILDRKPPLASLILSSSPPSVPRWISDCAELRAELDEPVRRVLDHHEAGAGSPAPNTSGRSPSSTGGTCAGKTLGRPAWSEPSPAWVVTSTSRCGGPASSARSPGA